MHINSPNILKILACTIIKNVWKLMGMRLSENENSTSEISCVRRVFYAQIYFH